jgi:transcriptional regulator with XRE-family HTH domain
MPRLVDWDTSRRVRCASAPALPRLIARLKAAGLTQAEIARRAELSPAYVSMLADGTKGGHASYNTVEALRQVEADVEKGRRAVTPPPPATTQPAPVVWRRPD